MKGTTYGFEGSVQWIVGHGWELNGSWTQLAILLHGSSTVVAEPFFSLARRTSPSHQFQVRSHWTLPRRTEFDLSAYSDAGLPSQSGFVAVEGIPPYTRVDARLGWFIGEQLSLSLNGQNLATGGHRRTGVIGA